MGIPEDLLPNVQAYCQVPAPDEADLLMMHQAWDAAAAYLAGAGIQQPERTSIVWPSWLQVMCAMTLDGYDQRGVQFDQGKLQDNPSFQRMKNQLKFDALPGEEAETN